MPVAVRLDFMPPALPGVASLHIEEAPAKEGPYSEIEEVSAVGTYPSYISYYTTQNATSTNYWFRIIWETSDGIFTPPSQSLQGGTRTLVQEIVDRVMLRNPSLNEIVVTQEAQAVVSEAMGTLDPNSISMYDATYVQIRGMTNLTLARSLIATTLAAGGSVSQFTAGIVSIKSGTTGADPTKAIEALIEAANGDLNLQYSVILVIKSVESEITRGSGQREIVTADLSRVIVEVA